MVGAGHGVQTAGEDPADRRRDERRVQHHAWTRRAARAPPHGSRAARGALSKRERRAPAREAAANAATAAAVTAPKRGRRLTAAVERIAR